MAVYATTTDLGKLGLIKEALKKFPPDQQTKQLSASSRKVDSYLANRYRLPLTAWDDDITQAVCILSAYEMMVSGGGWNPIPGSADEHLYLRYKDTIAWLKDVARTLATPTGITDSSAESDTDGMMPIISSDEPRGW